MKVSISTLNEYTGFDSKTIASKLKDLSYEPGPRGSKLYEIKPALRAVFEQKDVAKERARLLKAQADKAELDLKERQGELVSIEDVVKDVASEYTILRQRLLSIPNKLAMPLSSVTQPHEVQQILQAEIVELLTELSSDQKY